MSSDANYAVLLNVLVYSIIKNSSPEDELSFLILDSGLDDDTKKNIESYKTIKDFSVKYIKICKKRLTFWRKYCIFIASKVVRKSVLFRTTFNRLTACIL